MSNLVDQARPALDNLLQHDEDQLYTELASRVQAIRRDPSVSGSFDLQIDTGLEALGALDDVREFGQRFFERLSTQAYGLLCGADAENTAERQNVINAFGIGKEAVAPALAALLVMHLGLAPALAAVVAALAIKLFFRPAFDAMCDVWKGKLPQPTG